MPFLDAAEVLEIIIESFVIDEIVDGLLDALPANVIDNNNRGRWTPIGAV
ncbi:hypothetical protein J19TS2_11400 [Cohnella xylanilytica]|nr:hypothetical protein J19TS2_11400 [Cohnella xylanilytica]